MITYDEGNITCSYGDSFAIRFTLKNYKLKTGDTAIFSIKSVETKEVVLQGRIVGLGNMDSELIFAFSSSDMKLKVPVGEYTYDLVISDNKGWSYTTSKAHSLEVLEVSHYE